MSIVTVHGPYTFGSKAITEVGPAIATVNPANGLIWTFRLDQPSTRTASLVWTWPTGTPATATGPGPHTVTYGSAGTKANTAVSTGVGEGVNPYPPAGTINLPVTAVVGVAPRSVEAGDAEGGTEEEGAYDPGDHTVAEVVAYAESHPDEVPDIYDAEVAGKNRTTLVTHLEALIPFDPGEFNVDEVVAYAEENPAELEDIISAEQAGKNRSTLIAQLEGLRA